MTFELLQISQLAITSDMNYLSICVLLKTDKKNDPEREQLHTEDADVEIS